MSDSHPAAPAERVAVVGYREGAGMVRCPPQLTRREEVMNDEGLFPLLQPPIRLGWSMHEVWRKKGNNANAAGGAADVAVHGRGRENRSYC